MDTLFPCVSYWWDRSRKYWVIQHKDRWGYQIGDAIFICGADHAFREAMLMGVRLNLPVRKNA